jgi:hypothetical protein
MPNLRWMASQELRCLSHPGPVGKGGRDEGAAAGLVGDGGGGGGGGGGGVGGGGGGC